MTNFHISLADSYCFQNHQPSTFDLDLANSSKFRFIDLNLNLDRSDGSDRTLDMCHVRTSDMLLLKLLFTVHCFLFSFLTGNLTTCQITNHHEYSQTETYLLLTTEYLVLTTGCYCTYGPTVTVTVTNTILNTECLMILKLNPAEDLM